MLIDSAEFFKKIEILMDGNGREIVLKALTNFYKDEDAGKSLAQVEEGKRALFLYLSKSSDCTAALGVISYEKLDIMNAHLEGDIGTYYTPFEIIRDSIVH